MSSLTVNPLLSSRWGLFISSSFEGALFNLEKRMVSPERTRIQSGKAQVHAAEDQDQNRTSSW